jgi:hypothetical protein
MGLPTSGETRRRLTQPGAGLTIGIDDPASLELQKKILLCTSQVRSLS